MCPRKPTFISPFDRELDEYIEGQRKSTLYSDLVVTCGVDKIIDISKSPINECGLTNQRKKGFSQNKYYIITHRHPI